MKDKKDTWLKRSQEAYESSTSYLDTNYRPKWEDRLRHFQSKHKADSKYNKAAYTHRSKLFRPKTRTAERKNEAAAATVYFSNQDLVSIEARNPENVEQVVSSEINKELTNYHLTESIPWFTTLIGAFQDAQVVGAVCSYNYWKYEEKEITYSQSYIDEFGAEQEKEVKEYVVVNDRPCVDLRPIENIRIHPNSDWRDPINSSPYVIDLIPMYAYEVKAMTKKPYGKSGAIRWEKVSDGDLQKARTQAYDTTTSVRSGGMEDPTDKASMASLSDYDIVWVHRNIMRDDTGDVVFYTLSTHKRLSKPVPVEEEYPHIGIGKRPYSFGVGVIESHKTYPDSIVELVTPVQQEINENANQRMDNVKLVLNKRYVVKNGAQVDLRTILNNVAGSVTMANDPVGDIRTIEFNDVTGSSYQEQDRLNADFDGLAGDFSTSSIMTNRKLGETVGGMEMLRGGANSLTEYLLMTFNETWVEPTIKQIVKMIQFYETDEAVIAIAADKAKIWKRYGIESVSDQTMKQDLNIKVNVGFGSTDNQQKLEKFLFGVTKAVEIQVAAAQAQLQIDTEAIQNEIFGKLGYKSGARFFPEQDGEQNQQIMAQVQQMGQVIQQLQGQLQDKQADREAKLQQVQIQEQGKNLRDAAKGHMELFKEFNKDLPVEQVEGAMGQ